MKRALLARRVAALVVAALVVDALTVALVPALPAQAVAPAAAVATPSIVIAPQAGGVLTAGAALDAEVEVTNTGGAVLPAGRMLFSLDKGPVASAGALLDGIAHPPGQLQGILLSETAKTGAIAPGDMQRLRVHIPAAELNGVLNSQSGTRGFYAQFDADGVSPVIKEAAVTRMAKGFAGRTRLGVVIPLTAPANATGVVDTDTQGQLTAPGGAWDEALRAAAADPAVTIALDPEVIASIRLAGTSAPAGATAFLTALAALPNPVLELPYGDTDLTLAHAGDAPAVLAPTSFDGSTAAPPVPTGSTAAPTPTPAPASGTALTSVADLLDWNWTGPALSWPVRGTTTAAQVAGLAARGRTVVVSGSDVRDTAARVAAGPAARVSGHPVLIADSTASTLLSQAGAGGTPGRAALATLVGVLGTDAATSVLGTATPTTVPAVLAVSDRGRTQGDLDRALQVLDAQRWIEGASLDSLAKGKATVVPPDAAGQPASRVATATGLIGGERSVRALGAAVRDAAPLIGPERLALLGLLSASWRGRDADWSSAAAAGVKRFHAFVRQVHVNGSSPFVYTGDSSNLPVNVINDLPQPVTVVVRGTASNGRLQVTGTSVQVTVPANSGTKAKLPVKSITNGRVTVAVRLSTPDGAAIGGPVTQDITVRAGFEVIVAVALIAALGLLFLTGIYRNIARQRRRRPKAVPA